MTFYKPYTLNTTVGRRSDIVDTDVWEYMSVDPANKLEDHALALTCPGVLGTLPLLFIADQTIPAIGRVVNYISLISLRHIDDLFSPALKHYK